MRFTYDIAIPTGNIPPEQEAQLMSGKKAIKSMVYQVAKHVWSPRIAWIAFLLALPQGVEVWRDDEKKRMKIIFDHPLIPDDIGECIIFLIKNKYPGIDKKGLTITV